MNRAAAGVDFLAIEAQPFKQAYNNLEAEFKAFMDKVPVSGPVALQALAQEAPRFADKAQRLPLVPKPVRQPNKVPDERDAIKLPEPDFPPTIPGLNPAPGGAPLTTDPYM